MIKLSMSNIAWSFEERLEAYKNIAERGFSAIEIAPGLLFADCYDPFDPHPDIVLSRLSELKAFELSICSMQSLLFGREGCALFGTSVERNSMKVGLEKAIHLADRLGIPNLVFGSPKARIIPDAMHVEEATDSAIHFFQSLGDVAASHNTVIAIEANPKEYGTNFLTHYGKSAEFARQVGHKSVRVNFDVGSFVLNKDIENLNVAFETGFQYINHIHISEPYLAPAPDKESMDPVKSLLKLCGKLGYERFVSIEMRRPSNGMIGVDTCAARLSAVI